MEGEEAGDGRPGCAGVVSGVVLYGLFEVEEQLEAAWFLIASGCWAPHARDDDVPVSLLIFPSLVTRPPTVCTSGRCFL